MRSGKRANGSERRPPRRYQPLVVVCVGFCWGILLERWIDGLAELGWQVSVLALLSWFVCYRRRLYRWALFSLLTAVVSLGAFWHGQYWSHYPSTEIGRFLAEKHQPVCLEAIARSHAIELPGSAMGVPVHGQANPEYRLEVDVCAVRDGRRWRPVTGRAVLSVTGSIQQVQCGDRLRISAHGQRIPEPQNPGEFSPARYYRAQRTLVRLHGMANGVRVIEPAAGKVFFRFLEQVRQHARHQFNRHLPPREAALAAAIVVGQRGQLDSERREVFLVTGTLHLLVVSGFHVGILASGIWLLGRLGLFGRRSTLWIVIGLTILYAVLTGGRPPVTRAATLVLVLCGARLCGRPVFSGNTIALAALLLLIRNPTCLLDPGTQLSFLAVLAIMRGFTGSFDGREPDRLQQLVRRSRPWFQRFFIQLFGRVCRLTWISLLIWGATAPLVLHYFHVLSHAGILLNLVLYLPMVVVMFSGLGIWILGEVPVLVELPAWICRLNLVIIESTVEAVEGCRGSHVWGPGLPVCWLFGLYAVIAVGDYLTRRFRRWYHSLPLLLLLVGAGIVWPLTHGHWFDRSEGLRCTFIAVGHGTCVLLEMPDGQTWLYDAGAMGRPQTSGRRIAAVLWSRGIVRLDMVVLSHADADHYNAIPYLLDRFDVRQIGLTAVMADQLAGSCPGLYRAINSADVEISHWQAGDSWQLADGVELEVIQPPAEGLPGNDNSNSLVMVVKYQGEQILLPGDLEGSGLERLLATPPIPCSIVMAPHHGSVHSHPKRFADWSQPEWVIISTGGKPGNAEVADVYRARDAMVWSTATDGAVTICIDSTGKRLSHWR